MSCQIIVRCFTNGIEQILSVFAFYFYLNQKDKFTFSTVCLTATITLSFMMRNTSPIGWIPLLTIKVLNEGSFVPFLIAGIFVALPLIFLIVCIDTWYYLRVIDGSTWVFTSWNFVKMNILDGLSKFFGTDPYYYYLTSYMPAMFELMTPVVYLGMVTHVIEKRNKE